MTDTDLLARARAWQDHDPDPETRDEITRLVDAATGGDEAALAELADRFAADLTFGTAGLRGEMAAGPNRMNRAVVIRATAGLAAHLADHGQQGQPVVVGYDARHRSATFAADAAAVLSAAGHPVALADRPLPTPVVAFGVTHLGCCAGVQVTASHNPPNDNGYKVYLADGAQIIPPADSEIAAHIAAAGPATSTPMDDSSVRPIGADLIDAYLDGAVGTALHSPGARDVTIIYTPLHGVGRDVVLGAFARAGFPPPHVVAEQAAPDPDFPTVAFPNPEEPGALDLAVATARDLEADVVLANDPDVDRLAVVVPDPSRAGDWRPLSGDEIGILLADWLLSQSEGADRLVATTVVSSSMLGKLAAARGVAYAETLTGFKWIVRPGLARPDLRFVYGYEEALGSAVGSLVHDKDGITAALAFAELVATEGARGRRVTDRLDDLTRELGVHATGQRSVAVGGSDGLTRMRAVVDRLANEPPATLAGRRVTHVEDLRRGERLPPTDGVIVRADGLRLIVRPSGTEPKLKCYAEAVLPVEASTDLATARAAGQKLVAQLLDEAANVATS